MVSRFIFSCSAILILAGCASSPAKVLPCASTDWYELGRQNGSRGIASAQEDQIGKSCKSTEQKLDARAAYDSGVSLGLSEYCTESNGFQMGKANIKYNGSCPQVLEEAFLRGFQKGVKAVQLTNEKQNLRSKIESLELNLQKAHSLPLRGLLRAQKITLVSEGMKIDSQIATISRSITDRPNELE